MNNKITKVLFGLLFLSVIQMAQAQAPQKMSFQALIRNSSNELVVATNVGMKISILQGGPTGTPVYVETQTATTNNNGLVSLVVGNGAVVSGIFSAINWATGNYYVKTETDPAGGTNYTVSGTSQLLSVPYALYSGNATETDPQVASVTNNKLSKWNGTALIDSQLIDNGTNVGLGTTSPTDKLHIVGNVKLDAGKLSFVNTGNSVFIGEDAGLNDDLTNNQNTFVGLSTGKNNTTGNSNTYVGANSGVANVSGLSNIGIGVNALNKNNGNDNTVIGNSALFESLTGNSNIVIGNNAGNKSTGNSNLFIGKEAGYFNTGSNNVFIGNGAGRTETSSDKLYIDNSSTTNPLIYGDFLGNYLRVNGTLNINNAYSLPTTAGGFNQVIKSDGLGNSVWGTETDPKIQTSTTNIVPKWNGTELQDGIITDTGSNIGIATTNPTEKLEVIGKIKGTQLIMTNGATDGYVLQSNAAGAAFWVNPAILPINENDPQVTTSTANVIPKWNGTSLADGTMYDSGANIGIGTNEPLHKLNVFGGDLVVDKGSGLDLGRKIAVGGRRGAAGNAFAQIDFNNYDSGADYLAAGIRCENPTGIGAGDMRFITSDNSVSSTKMIITHTGNVGIGTVNPTQAKLVINGSVAQTFTSYGYLNRTTPTGTFNGSATNDYSIYASDRIAAPEFNAFSDERIKKIIGVPNKKEDLKTLLNIEITDYKLKDSITKGNKNYKKVIAQQVEKVYPQAVSLMTDVVPDIYKQAKIKNGFIAIKNNLKIGEKVKLIKTSGPEIVEVIEANANGFMINSNATEDVFVFGRQVNDFHTVDYEALATLNISATQELFNEIQKLKVENTSLKAEMTSMAEVKKDVELLKSMLYNTSASAKSEAMTIKN